jgi:Protein kinase domain/3-keto-disaccharide hydrolase
VLNWVSQVCDALAYLHSQPSPIIHRDIKPANIKIRPDGRAVLVDFGIAKIYDPHLATTIGAKAVTPGYSPPEQYGGGATDARSDVYALGATLYHLLTGHIPPESVQRMVGGMSLPSPRQINGQISPTVEQAILRAVEVATDRRFQSVDQLRTALAQPRPATAPPVQPRQTPPSAKIQPQARRSFPILLLVLLGCGGLIILTVCIWALLPRQPVAVTVTPVARDLSLESWTTIGGDWSWPEKGILYGQTNAMDGLHLYDKDYGDFTFSAQVQAVDREASLAFRMQDDHNGYLVILVPQGARGGNPGLYLYKRVDGREGTGGSYGDNLPTIGEWALVSVQAAGSKIMVSLNGKPVIELTDTESPVFRSGKLGFRIYGDRIDPCHAYFRNIQLP